MPGTQETLKQPECSVAIQVTLKYWFLTVWTTSNTHCFFQITSYALLDWPQTHDTGWLNWIGTFSSALNWFPCVNSLCDINPLLQGERGCLGMGILFLNAEWNGISRIFQWNISFELSYSFALLCIRSQGFPADPFDCSHVQSVKTAKRGFL